MLLAKFSSAIFQLFSTFQLVLSRGLTEGLYTGFNSVLDSLSWGPPFFVFVFLFSLLFYRVFTILYVLL